MILVLNNTLNLPIKRGDYTFNNGAKDLEIQFIATLKEVVNFSGLINQLENLDAIETIQVIDSSNNILFDDTNYTLQFINRIFEESLSNSQDTTIVFVKQESVNN